MPVKDQQPKPQTNREEPRESSSDKRESVLDKNESLDASSVKVDLSRRTSSRNLMRKFFLYGGLIVLLSLVGFGGYLYSVTNTKIIEKGEQFNIFGQLHRIIDENVDTLDGEGEDRINLLLLGEGGLTHPGGTLTDTIMVASIQPSTKRVGLISIPRDLVVEIYPDPENKDYFEYRKINYAVELGGVALAQAKIKEITGLSIHYYIKMDFAGFRNVIDSLGGLNIYIENSFTDYEYPDYNYGYQTISFEQGWQHLSGEEALQFTRSRHGNNGEGSDFARAQRQQNILAAFRDEVLSASTLFNPTKIAKILNDVGNHVSTNIELWEMSRLATLAQEIDQDAIVNKVIDNSTGGLLYSEISSETGAYVLVPNAGLGNYSELIELAQSIFELSEVQQVMSKEDSVISVQNGSSIAGLAGSTAKNLERQSIEVNGVANALVKNRTESVLYDLTNNQKPSTRAILEELLGLKAVQATVPTDPTSKIRLGSDLDQTIINFEALPENLDFLVLVGSDLSEQSTLQASSTPATDTTGQSTAEDDRL